MQVHHYMVDYEDKTGSVRFANNTAMHDLSEAKALAKRQSKVQPCRAAVVAFVASPEQLGFFTAVGCVAYFDGRVSDVSGEV